MKILRWKKNPLARFLTLFSFEFVSARLRSLDREAAMDSVRNILAVIGASTLLGDFARLSWYLYLPSLAILALVWYMDYLRHEFPKEEKCLES